MHETAYSSDLFQLAKLIPFSDVHFWRDEQSQLEAIIAIHSTKLGPAVGGCRFVSYESSNLAVQDALRLARSMSFKSAINTLPFGGGKAVILKPNHITNRQAMFESFGEFVNSLNGRYITAMDSGTTTDDMNIIASKTPHVVCTSDPASGSASGDPAPYTAKGVYYGIKAAVKFKLNKDSLKNVHIAIQGVGHVGYQLAKLLFQDGAKLSVSDFNETAVKRVVDEFNASPVSTSEIMTLNCDVFSPCALGQILHPESIEKLNTSIVAGSANNQLQNDALGDALLKKGILYAPDYVINSGGIIQIAYLSDEHALDQKLRSLYDTLSDIYSASQKEQVSTVTIANQMVEAKLKE